MNHGNITTVAIREEIRMEYGVMRKAGTLQKLQCLPKAVVYRASDCRDPKLFLSATKGCRNDFKETDCDGTSTPFSYPKRRDVVP